MVLFRAEIGQFDWNNGKKFVIYWNFDRNGYGLKEGKNNAASVEEAVDKTLRLYALGGCDEAAITHSSEDRKCSPRVYPVDDNDLSRIILGFREKCEALAIPCNIVSEDDLAKRCVS